MKYRVEKCRRDRFWKDERSSIVGTSEPGCDEYEEIRSVVMGEQYEIGGGYVVMVINIITHVYLVR